MTLITDIIANIPDHIPIWATVMLMLISAIATYLLRFYKMYGEYQNYDTKINELESTIKKLEQHIIELENKLLSYDKIIQQNKEEMLHNEVEIAKLKKTVELVDVIFQQNNLEDYRKILEEGAIKISKQDGKA